MYYILGGADGFTPVACNDVKEWARQFSHDGSRRVDHTVINEHLFISTVFLGLEHGRDNLGRPLLFETMVFRNGEGCDTFRAATWEEARRVHDYGVSRLLKGLPMFDSDDGN